MDKKLMLLIFVAFAFTQSFSQDKKPNILFIMIDDLRTELNSYDANYIISPNIDKIVLEGVQFNKAYCQQAVCSASRASMLSGVRPDVTGVDYPYSVYYMTEFRPQHRTMPEEFEKQGYHVQTFGKIHHGAPDNLKTKHFNPKNWTYYAKQENIELGGKKGRNKNTPAWESADVEDNAYFDGMIADEAVKQIKKVKNSEQPFMMAVGFKKPHLPFTAPKKYFDLYNSQDIGLAPNREAPKNVSKYATNPYALSKYKGPNDLNGKRLPEAYQLQLRHAYAACVSFVDTQVGKLITAIEEIGERENTIVVIVSDHGWHLGHQGMWGKTTNFENATRAPLIISAPNKLTNVKLDQLVEYVDIYPTLMDLAGLNSIDYFEGTSMVPLMENDSIEWKSAVFSQFPRGKKVEGYAIRTKDFRYIEWRSKIDNNIIATELYDHRNDELETNNVAQTKAYELIVKELSNKLEKGWKASLPLGVKNHSKNSLAPPHVSWSSEAKKQHSK